MVECLEGLHHLANWVHSCRWLLELAGNLRTLHNPEAQSFHSQDIPDFFFFMVFSVVFSDMFWECAAKVLFSPHMVDIPHAEQIYRLPTSTTAGCLPFVTPCFHPGWDKLRLRRYSPAPVDVQHKTCLPCLRRYSLAPVVVQHKACLA